MQNADSQELAAVREDLDALAHELRDGHGFWPVAGALLVNLRNIIAALDVVADAQPVEVRPRPLTPACGRGCRRR